MCLDVPWGKVWIAPFLPKTEMIQTEARGDRDEKGDRRADLLYRGLVPSQVGVLDDVVGVTARADHAVGNGKKPHPVGFKHCGDLVHDGSPMTICASLNPWSKLFGSTK